ncbi:Glycosidase [Arcanobacterium phocae]|uniref:Alpha-amylase n=1 Tax=Arcanobacterium phocae TaxID=131112 RepID=A0A1H2LC62_9ACTO|nr:alpha-amylase family glycosyl hydrolase [Arcanobacterium phocae]SDU78519.1 Glycosidase [Arcanobacterium phocae]
MKINSRKAMTGIIAGALAVAMSCVVPSASAASSEGSRSSVGYSSDLAGDVIYQIVVDRFYDGNPGNNDPASAPGMFSQDKSNWQLYWGGDFAGITAKIDYLKKMGVGAIWISPPVKNMSVPAIDQNGTKLAGYHGYWGMDFFVPDPHFGTWKEFDAMVKAAHKAGIKVVMDWAMNHTSPEDVNNVNYGVNGALEKNGERISSYNSDPAGYFHHNGGVSDYNHRYQMRYQNLFNLADLAQENPATEAYLKEAVDTWIQHGVDGIRMDAVKHMSQGFQKAYVDHIYSQKGMFVFGEWADTATAPLWQDEINFANASGQSVENFDLNASLHKAFGQNMSIKEVDAVIGRQQEKFNWPNHLINFVDGHDVSRLLSIRNDTNKLDQATIIAMTAPGIPSIYYGDEQYSHNDETNFSQQRGGDPFNRQQMPKFDTETKNFKVIRALSDLRKDNPALRYGISQQRWINDDVYVYERHFFNDVVLVAVNKGQQDQKLDGLRTRLPQGKYDDRLKKMLGGGTLSVMSGTGEDRATGEYILKAGQAAVWSYVSDKKDDAPKIGNIGPTMGRQGNMVVVSGKDFGTDKGAVTVAGTPATVKQWTSQSIEFVIPNTGSSGIKQVTVTSKTGKESNAINYEILSGPQTQATFSIDGISMTMGDELYLSGDVPELGDNNADRAMINGPAACPQFPKCFINVSVPQNKEINYKFFIKRKTGEVEWQQQSHRATISSPQAMSFDVSW